MKFSDYLGEVINDDIEDKIISYFTLNKNIKDSNIHSKAEEWKINAHELENKIYDVLGSFLNAGLSNEKQIKESDVDKNELDKGMKVEMEHTTNKKIAKRIALDHLSELKDYYIKLEKIEKK